MPSEDWKYWSFDTVVSQKILHSEMCKNVADILCLGIYTCNVVSLLSEFHRRTFDNKRYHFEKICIIRFCKSSNLEKCLLQPNVTLLYAIWQWNRFSLTRAEIKIQRRNNQRSLETDSWNGYYFQSLESKHCTG